MRQLTQFEEECRQGQATTTAKKLDVFADDWLE
jgi:hypothetical protein